MTKAIKKYTFKGLPLKNFLQLFADNGSDGGNGTEGGNGSEGGQDGGQGGNSNPSNSLNLDELLKDPVFKQQYQDKLQQTLNKRMKQYEGIDVNEYKRLKDEEEANLQKNMTDLQKKDSEIAKLQGQIANVETREKTLAVKEYCVENGFNQKLVTRLIDLSAIKSENGEFTGVKEAIESLSTEFPEIVKTVGDNHQQQGSATGNSYNSGSGQRGNNPPNNNPYDIGKQIAEQRNQAKADRQKQFQF